MESRAGVEEYRRFSEPDPEMEIGGYRTPHKPIYATALPIRQSCSVRYFHPSYRKDKSVFNAHSIKHLPVFLPIFLRACSN